MAKGYWIANVDVRDADGYKAYVAMLPDIFRKYGGRYTTRGGRTEMRGRQEPQPHRGDRIPELCDGARPATARRNTPRPSRMRQAAADADMIVIEGYDGPQPDLPPPPAER